MGILQAPRQVKAQYKRGNKIKDTMARIFDNIDQDLLSALCATLCLGWQ